MGQIHMQYHHMGMDYGQGGKFDCPHCGKSIFLEARTLPDGTGDYIIIAFAAKPEQLEQEFEGQEEQSELDGQTS